MLTLFDDFVQIPYVQLVAEHRLFLATEHTVKIPVYHPRPTLAHGKLALVPTPLMSAAGQLNCFTRCLGAKFFLERTQDCLSGVSLPSKKHETDTKTFNRPANYHFVWADASFTNTSSVSPDPVQTCLTSFNRRYRPLTGETTGCAVTASTPRNQQWRHNTLLPSLDFDFFSFVCATLHARQIDRYHTLALARFRSWWCSFPGCRRTKKHS